MTAITKARRSTSAKIRDAELPECFQAATVAAGVAAYSRSTKSARAARRRLRDKVAKLEERR